MIMLLNVTICDTLTHIFMIDRPQAKNNHNNNISEQSKRKESKVTIIVLNSHE